jgi:hypothetical protein
MEQHKRMDQVRAKVRYNDQGGLMSTTEKEKEQATENCSTGSCSTDKTREQAQKESEKKELKVEQPATKVHGSCCG